MIKRLIDIVVAAVLLLLFSPLMAGVALLIRLKLGTPVFFIQQRPGRHGKAFRMVKFRTMRDERDARGELLPSEQRHTTFGKLLRSTSLDEMPELWNVLKGDMSLVGPRPLLMDYLPLYTPEQYRRHEVRPGITGWAQVNGRNAITWEEKFRLDTWYVDHHSLLLDVRILLSTVQKVFSREGISHGNEVGMPRFQGVRSTHHGIKEHE